VKIKNLNLVFGSKMGTHRNTNHNLEHSEISQNKTPGDSKIHLKVFKNNIKISLIYVGNMVLFEVNKFKNTPKING